MTDSLGHIARQLDLEAYIDELKEQFAREKSIVIGGDISIHFKLIDEISKKEFKTPPKIKNLDDMIKSIDKKSIINLEMTYEFIKIVNYFKYLKDFSLDGRLSKWFDDIVLPLEISNIAQNFDNDGAINIGFNEELDHINHSLEINKRNIKQHLYQSTNEKSLSPYLVDRSLHLVQNEQTIMVRGGFMAVIKAKIIDRSQNGFFYIVPNSVLKLKEQRSNLLDKKEELLWHISKEFSNILYRHRAFVNYINKQFDRFDHYIARVNFAKIYDNNFILPSKQNKNSLLSFEHPAISNPTPISIDFDKNIIIITGVNAGGKTMLLKSILSACFMSKYLVPYSCHINSSLSSFKDIKAILDDPQNVKNDISTFAGRMLQFSKLFDKKDMLIGVDEIELGTDSDEAASLFKVIVEQLEAKNNKIVITTHHKRLASLLSSHTQTQLVAAIYDENKELPTYRFLTGTIGKSYAFETASRYNVPQHIVQEAKKVYGEDQQNLNELITKSAKFEQQMRQKIKELDEKINKQHTINKQLIEQKEQNSILQAKLIKELKQQYNDLIDSAKKINKDMSMADRHRALNETSKKLKDIKIRKNKDHQIPKIGQRVSYHNTKGELISKKGKKAIVWTDDGIKLQIDIDKLTISNSKTKPIVKKNISLKLEKPKEGFIKLDLHGLRALEAIEKLDKFLSDSLLNGIEEVLVYHGIGEGKLSRVVKEFLDEYPAISTYEDAPMSMGGYGAKIIKF